METTRIIVGTMGDASGVFLLAGAKTRTVCQGRASGEDIHMYEYKSSHADVHNGCVNNY